MQGLPAEGVERVPGVRPELMGLSLEAGTVDVIPQQRVPDRGKVNADLVRAPGLQPARQEAHHRRAVRPGVTLEHLPVGQRLAAALAHRHLVTGVRVAIDRLVDGAAWPVGYAPDKSQVATA